MKISTLLLGLVLLSASSLAEATTHVVQAGDNMFRISLRYGITLSQLQAANPGVKPESIRVGQKLNIPGQAKSAPSSAVAEESVAPAAPAPTMPSASGETYTVQAGDNLSKIARLHGTTVAALQAANPKLKPNQVIVGQRLVLPTGQATRGANQQPAVAQAPTPAPVKEKTPPAPLPVAKASSTPSPLPQQKPLATVDSTTPAPTSTVSQVGQTPMPTATPAYRLIKTTRELTLEQVAKEYKTTTDKINSLNGWSFSPQTLLAVDSELYIPTQP